MTRREFLKSCVAGILALGLGIKIAEAGFTCARCGRCCQEIMSPNYWIRGLSWEEKQILVAERKKYPKVGGKKCCDMLYFDDIAHCLVWEVFGRNRMPKSCREYPKAGEKCLNGVWNREEI